MPASEPPGGSGGAAGGVVASDASTVATPNVPAGAGQPSASARGPLASPASLTAQMTDLSRRGMGERPRPNYGRNAQSPIPYMVISLVVGAAAIGVVHWALQPVSHASRHGITTAWWRAIITTVLGQNHLSLSGVDHPRLWWAVAAIAVAVVLFVVWVRRLGQNARADAGFFGAILVIAAFPFFWTLPLTIGGSFDSQSEMRFRTTLALLMLVVQALFARWAMVHKLWRAARFEYEYFAYLLWVPLTVAAAWLAGSLTWTAYSLKKARFRGAGLANHGVFDIRSWVTRSHGAHDSSWVPTDGIMRVEMWATRATGVAVLLLLIAVTVSQHLGIRQDEAVAEEWNAK